MRSSALQSMRTAERHAGWMLAAGLGAVGLLNWRQWRRDRALADQLSAERAPAPMIPRVPPVSALVAAWNEGERIEAHIRSFLALTYPSIELVLCAGGSDDTLERARRYAGERVTVIEQRPGEGKQRALARCLEHARGEIIYLTDADCLFDDEALARLIEPIVAEGEQAATGASRPLDEQLGSFLPVYVWAQDVAAAARQPRHVGGLLGRNAALTRAAVAAIGGLDFEAPTGTDFHLACRLVQHGIPIRSIPQSVVRSDYPAQLGPYWRKRTRWARNLITVGMHYRSHGHVLSGLRSAAAGAAIVSLPIAGAIMTPLLSVLWAVLLMHAVLAKLRYLVFTGSIERRSIDARYAICTAIMTLVDLGIWCAPLAQLVTTKGRDRW